MPIKRVKIWFSRKKHVFSHVQMTRTDTHTYSLSSRIAPKYVAYLTRHNLNHNSLIQPISCQAKDFSLTWRIQTDELPRRRVKSWRWSKARGTGSGLSPTAWCSAHSGSPWTITAWRSSRLMDPLLRHLKWNLLTYTLERGEEWFTWDVDVDPFRYNVFSDLGYLDSMWTFSAFFWPRILPVKNPKTAWFQSTVRLCYKSKKPRKDLACGLGEHYTELFGDTFWAICIHCNWCIIS